MSNKKQALSEFLKNKPPAFNETFFKEIYLEAIEQGYLGKTVQYKTFKIRLLKDYQFYEEIKLDKHSIYHKKEMSIYEILSFMNNSSYLSHYTAMSILGLTDQIPKTIYVTLPQKRKSKQVVLTQEDIDSNYTKPFIKTQNLIEYNEKLNICILNSMDNYNEERIELSSIYGYVRLSGYEKTLIDIAVRPEYSGGIYEVAEAYRRASTNISGSDLFNKLKNQAYSYPYHQAIGFYMELVGGYSKSIIRSLKSLQLKNDFYLIKGLNKNESNYNEVWRIFYPKDFNF